MSERREKPRRGMFAEPYSLAEALHQAYVRWTVLEEEVGDALMEAAGIDPNDVEGWPLTDITFDWYDNSFEFHGVTLGWKPSRKVRKQWGDIGFKQYWICYTDGSEQHGSTL